MRILRDMWTHITGRDEDARQLEAARAMCRLHDARNDRLEAEIRDLRHQLYTLRATSAEIRGTYQGGAVEPAWEAEDAARLNAFLKSPTGARLKARVNFQEQKINREAIWMKDRIENATGYARGFGDGLFFITCDLPVHAPPQEGPANKEQPGDAALVERLSP